MVDSIFDQMMSIVIVGHVDHGKSTIIGRLLADTDSLPKGKLEQVKESCERNSKPFEYAFLIDALKDERSQGITIDSARVFFKSDKRHYLINDAPGHIEFLKNMVTGASRSEAALIVIDAQEGIQENSLRHGYLLWMLGIKKIVVLVNKMDLVGYRQDVFDQIKNQYNNFLSGVGLYPQSYIPVSGREGDNIASQSLQMPWFTKGTVLTALDEFESEPPLTEQPFRMPVQDVYKFTLFGDNRRIVAGNITSGKVNVGDEVVFFPSGKHSVVKTIEGFNQPDQFSLVCGNAAGLTLAEQIYVQRGEIVTRANQPSPKISTRLRVSLFWLGKTPMQLKNEYWLKLATTKVKVRIETIHRIIDASQDDDSADTGQTIQLTRIHCNQVAECTLQLNKAIAFDLANEFGDTGRFVIVDNHEISGGGIILEDLPDPDKDIREDVWLRNYKWIKSSISSEDRAEKYNQRATLILITGQKGAGRKRTANLLEADLISNGKFVYFLGIGNVIHGIDADIKEKDHEISRHEHIRRLAEVAHILLDAGLILIVTAIELTQAELEMIKAIVDGNRIETIWVGDTKTTDLSVDLQVPGGEQSELSAFQIKSLLRDRGYIFAP
ncbi:MAG TPA: GTP-binding protein [Anaerolineaceae bacterium]|nr:GTP-binding protein [Anaerolineaceae bacterium]